MTIVVEALASSCKFESATISTETRGVGVNFFWMCHKSNKGDPSSETQRQSSRVGRKGVTKVFKHRLTAPGSPRTG